MNVFTFDIETIPDVAVGRRLYHLDGLDDREVANVMFQKRRQETGGSEFLRLHLQRIVAIAVVLRSADRFKVWSLGDPESPEEELVRRFFAGLERYTPTLVSWNGGNFDLPVLHYRALVHGIAAARYWDTGAEDSSFRWNNYLSRYHARHTDLMDVLAAYSPRAGAPLDEIAVLLGLPGKMGMNGADVWDSYLQGAVGDIRRYCETDVLNTYLIYLRFELIRGRLTATEYEQECRLVSETLARQGESHLRAFLDAWESPKSSSPDDPGATLRQD